MDRGRQIDNVQNCNAVFIDRFGRSGKTSTRIMNPPGGKDHFSLGWDEPQQKPSQQKSQYAQQSYGQPQNDPPSGNKPRIDRRKQEQDLPRNIPQHGYGNYSNNQPPQYQQPKPPQQPQQHTSVRVNQRPGGNSNIIFGNDDSNYEHYRK